MSNRRFKFPWVKEGPLSPEECLLILAARVNLDADDAATSATGISTTSTTHHLFRACSLSAVAEGWLEDPV